MAFVFDGDEEAGLAGTRWLIKNRKDFLKDISKGVVLEPTELNIRIVQKGTTFFKVIFKGKAAHGSRPDLGDNAIMKAVRFLQEIDDLKKEVEKRGSPLLRNATINVGKISGGTKVNVVPDHCEVEIDRRIVPSEKIENAQNEIIKLSNKFGGDILKNYTNPPIEVSENLEIVKLLKDITKSKLYGGDAYTEFEIFTNEVGIECVTCGPGDMGVAHKVDEFVSVDNLKKGKKVFTELVKRWCL